MWHPFELFESFLTQFEKSVAIVSSPNVCVMRAVISESLHECLAVELSLHEANQIVCRCQAVAKGLNCTADTQLKRKSAITK